MEDAVWFWAFILFSVVERIVFSWIDVRQLRHLQKRQLPARLKTHVTEEEAEQSFSYSIDKLRFSILESVFSFALNMAQWGFFFFPWLWQLSKSLSLNWFGTPSEYIVALIFCGVQIPVNRVLSLPFELYYDFVIEARYGFNKKTLKLFFVDDIKRILLSIVIGSPIISAVIWIVKWGGRTFYFWLWAFSAIVSLLMMTIYPNLIAPLFNKYEPLKDATLKTKLEDLARSVSFPLKKLYQVDESKRSAHSNAYMYGFWKNKRIVLYDTLLETSHERILAIVGHELGHWKKWHTVKMFGLSFANLFFVFFLFGFVFFNDSVYRSFGFLDGDRPVIIGLMVFFNVYQPVSIAITVLFTLLSRKNEFQADEFSCGLGMGEHLGAALLELQKKNLGALSVDPVYLWVHYSHPHLTERLAAIEAFQEKEVKKEK